MLRRRDGTSRYTKVSGSNLRSGLILSSSYIYLYTVAKLGIKQTVMKIMINVIYLPIES